jgi:hypothetical protein
MLSGSHGGLSYSVLQYLGAAVEKGKEVRDGRRKSKFQMVMSWLVVLV